MHGHVWKFPNDGSNGEIIVEGIYELAEGFSVRDDGSIFIAIRPAALSNYSEILKWNPSSGSKNVELFFGRNGNGSNSNQLYRPFDLSFDSNGNLFIADKDNNRIQKIDFGNSIIISAGETSGSANIKSINDIIDEEDETVIVNPGTVVNATISNSDSITFTITDDDDPPSIEYNVSSDFIEENSSNDVEITGTLSSLSGKDVEIPFTVSGTASSNEYTITESPVTIKAGSLSGKVVISTKDIDDTEVEPVETIILKSGTIINATSQEYETTINLISDDYPDIKSISFDKVEIFEHEKSNLTATLSAPHSKESEIIFDISGTATIDVDYNYLYSKKGTSKIYSGGNGIGSESNQFNNPQGLSLDSDGNLYVADWKNSRVQKISKGGDTSTIVKDVEAIDVHVDSSDNIYVLKKGSSVVKYDSTGTFISEVHTGAEGSYAMYVDSNEDIYTVSSSSSFKSVYKSTKDNTQASVLFTDDRLHFANSIALDSDGNVYVSGQNMSIIKWNKETSESSYLDGKDSIGNPYGFSIGAGSRAISITNRNTLLVSSDSGYEINNQGVFKASLSATITEYVLENGNANFKSVIFKQDLEKNDYYVGINALVDDGNGNVYLALGKDENQSGTNFNNSNIPKRQSFICLQWSCYYNSCRTKFRIFRNFCN